MKTLLSSFNYEQRPLDMLYRQQQANRSSARNKKHFCHLAIFRAAFVRDILNIRNEIRQRSIK